MNSKCLCMALLVISAAPVASFATMCNENNCCDDCFFVQVGSGYSWSMCSKICADEKDWDAAQEGYNAKLCNVPVFEAGLGYHFRPWLAASVTAAYRGMYHYKKFQTPLANLATPGASGSKTRYFDLENTSIMFNLILTGTNCWTWEFCNCMSVAPYLAGGVGIARNKVFNFHSVLERIGNEIPQTDNCYVSGIVPDYIRKFTFAGHADLGIDWMLCERAHLNFGYRFFYGGKFQSNNYLSIIPGGINDSTPFNRPITMASWCGKLKANEIFFDLSFNF